MSDYWQAYSASVKLGPEPYVPLGWKRRLRRWAYLKTGWSRWFSPFDWMTMLQMLQSASRLGEHQMRQMMGDPSYKLGGPIRQAKQENP